MVEASCVLVGILGGYQCDAFMVWSTRLFEIDSVDVVGCCFKRHFFFFSFLEASSGFVAGVEEDRIVDKKGKQTAYMYIYAWILRHLYN